MKRSIHRRLICLLLAGLAVLSLCVPASAAGISNFNRKNTYSNQYTDVNTGGWAFPYIRTCYETGMMTGKGTTSTFVPKGNLTVVEALALAARLHETYYAGRSTLSNGSPWYQPYVDYTISNGLIGRGDFSSYNTPVTRAEMAYIFVSALPASELSARNSIQAGHIPDLGSAAAKYRSAILTLYNAGVLTGNDAYGTYTPNANITREQTAGIIARMVDPAQRVDFVPLKNYAATSTVTFAGPQTAPSVSSGNSGVADYVTYAFTSSPWVAVQVAYRADTAGTPVTARHTVAEEQALYPASGGYSDVQTSVVSFGATAAYRTTGTYTLGGTQLRMAVYRFITGGQFEEVMILYRGQARDTVFRSMVNNVRVNGNTPTPTY